MTNEELDQRIEREYKANRPVAAGALLMLRCLNMPPDMVAKHQGKTMQECFHAGVYYALALLRGVARTTGAQPMPPTFADLFEQLYSEVKDRTVMGRIDIEGQFDGDGTKH